MSRMNQNLLLFALLAMSVPLLATLSGCGSSSPINSAITQPDQPAYVPPVATGIAGGSSSGGSSSGGSSSGVSFTPSQSYSFSIYGTGSGQETYTTPPFSTDNLLKIRITPDAAGAVNVPGSNFQAAYACANFTVSVVGQSQSWTPEAPLGVTANTNSFCPNTSEVHDFSSALGQGHGTIQIQISKPMYDYYCQLWYSGQIFGTYNQYCPLHTVYQTHNVNGHVELEVNGASI